MTDLDLTALAGDAASKLLGWETTALTICVPGMGSPSSETWLMLHSLTEGAPAALLFYALLDWCAERDISPSIMSHGGGPWVADVSESPAGASHCCHHATKLGALLLALHRAGVAG